MAEEREADTRREEVWSLAVGREIALPTPATDRWWFDAGYDARDAEVEALRKRVEDLKLALGDNAGWFDRYRAERTRAETAERKLAEAEARIATMEREAELELDTFPQSREEGVRRFIRDEDKQKPWTATGGYRIGWNDAAAKHSQMLERETDRLTRFADESNRARVAAESELSRLRTALGEVREARREHAREGRQLLRRFVKYAREDRAQTPGSTRLERLTGQVDDYLQRTNDPRDILRGDKP